MAVSRHMPPSRSRDAPRLDHMTPASGVTGTGCCERSQLDGANSRPIYAAVQLNTKEN